jgi:DNA-binding NarL/FixJ family response regulator
LNPTSKDSRKTIRVVLAEDQGMVLGALAALLEIEGDISVIAQAKNGKELWKRCWRTSPMSLSPTSRCRT